MRKARNHISLRGTIARAVTFLFIRSGILPSDQHDLMANPGARLGSVLRAAFAHLRQSNASLDKWILFVAVVCYLVTAWAFLGTAVLLLIASTAHAQTTTGSAAGFFQPPNPQQDLAQNWLNYLFRGQDISQYVSQSGQSIPQATNIQQALQTALGIYSDAILVVAGFILFYHLISMLVETAHHGVPMGKRASQIWAPIRLVVAIGLLVPVSSGLNSGQYIVIRVAEMGSGLASTVWQTFLTALASEGPTYHAPNAPYVRKVVQDLVAMEACRLTYNYYTANTMGMLGTDYSSMLVQPTAQAPIVDPVTGMLLPTGNATLYTNSLLSDQGICGSYEVGTSTPPPQGSDKDYFENQIPAQIAQAHLATIQSLMNSGQVTTVAKNIKFFIPSFSVTTAAPNGFTTSDNTGTNGNLPSNAPMEALVTLYQTTLQQALSSAMSNMYDNSLQNLATQWSGQGWVSAGAWFNTIARSQGAIMDATQDGLPKTVAPQVAKMTLPSDGFSKLARWVSGQQKTTEEAYSVANLTAAALENFYSWADSTGSASTPGASTSSQDAQKVAQQKLKDAAAGESDSGWNLMNGLLAMVDAAAVATGAWSNGDLAFQFSNTANPLAEVAYLGHSYLSTGLSILAGAGISSTIAGGLSFIPGIGGAAASALSFLTAIAVFIATIIIAGGFTLSFLVPLLPFIWFFFNVLTWILGVLEGVVLMPLIALAHLNPEGEGLPGGTARNAYFLILNIFLRPGLMVFGLICGLLLFFVAISFLNMMYTTAMAGTGASSGGFHTIAKLVFSVLYVGLAYICANHSFKAIGYFPEHALRWLGSGGHHENMGTPEHMASIMSGVAAIGGKELGASLQKPGQLLRSAGSKHVSDQKTAATTKERDDRLIAAIKGEQWPPDQSPGGHSPPGQPPPGQQPSNRPQPSQPPQPPRSLGGSSGAPRFEKPKE